MTDHLDSTPTHEARRHAVANALAWAPGLVRYAARFTHSIEDAEDAYQAAMEIALTKAPTVERRDFTRWIQTVIRHEALRIRRSRSREAPTTDDALDVQTSSDGAQPQAIAEWRERYRGVQDGLLGLKERTRVCVMLRSAGLQRNEIADLLDVSLRVVSREIHEGRRQLRDFEMRLESGAECERAVQLMDPAVDGEASAREVRRLERHARHCASCRDAYRVARYRGEVVASLVPMGLMTTDMMAAKAPDASGVMNWWERSMAAGQVRTGQMMQVWMDIPQLLSSKAGAGAVAVAAASAIGGPAVVQSLRADSVPAAQANTPALVQTTPELARSPMQPQLPSLKKATTSAPPKKTAPSKKASSTSASATPDPTPARTTGPAPAPPRSSNPTPSSGSAAAEFSP